MVGDGAIEMMLVVESEVAESEVETVGGGDGGRRSILCVAEKAKLTGGGAMDIFLAVSPWDVTNCCVTNRILHTNCRIT